MFAVVLLIDPHTFVQQVLVEGIAAVAVAADVVVVVVVVVVVEVAAVDVVAVGAVVAVATGVGVDNAAEIAAAVVVGVFVAVASFGHVFASSPSVHTDHVPKNNRKKIYYPLLSACSVCQKDIQ